MMKRKIVATMCCILILSTISGCRLAKEDFGTNSYDDRLIGVLITTEYLDLFDFQGGEINLDGGNTQKYQGRLYAALIPKTYTKEETGETILTYEYVFEGIEGIQHCVPTMQPTEEENSYVAFVSDPAISDVHMDIFVDDDESRVSIDGAVFIIPSNKTNIYYFNPIFQSADGSVYAVMGSGFRVTNETYSGEGTLFSQTLDVTTTITENGKAKKDSVFITISISVLFTPEKIVVLQMDAKSQLIERAEYAPGTLPQEFTPASNVSYIIVETHKRDSLGNSIISRDIYDRVPAQYYASTATFIATFSARDDGFCTKNYSQLKWQ